MTMDRATQGDLAHAAVVRFVRDMKAKGVPEIQAAEAILVHSVMLLAKLTKHTPADTIGNLKDVFEEIERGPTQ